MNNTTKNALIIWVVLTIAVNFFLYSVAIDHLFLTREERANPMIIFFRFLPQTGLFMGIAVGVVTLIIKAFKNKSNEG
jgi:hypothetical protein